MVRKLFFLVAIVAMLASCSDDNEVVTVKSEKEISMYVGEQSQIEASGNGLSYGSVDAFCASVDDRGLITANHVGTTTIRVADKNSNREYVYVDVIPRSELFVEPFHEFGTYKSVVLEMYGSSYTEVDGGVCYELDDSKFGQAEEYYFYFAQNEDKKQVLVKSAVKLESGTTGQNLNFFLEERYKHDEDSEWLFRDTEEKSALTVSIDAVETGGQWVVAYQ